MRSVYKYPIRPRDYFLLELPRGAELLHVHSQGDAMMLWALVDPAQPIEQRKFRLAGTGHDISDESVRYVGTGHLMGGAPVFHLFEVLQ